MNLRTILCQLNAKIEISLEKVSNIFFVAFICVCLKAMLKSWKYLSNYFLTESGCLD